MLYFIHSPLTSHPTPHTHYSEAQKSIWHAGRQSMFNLNQIGGIASERAYSVTEQI